MTFLFGGRLVIIIRPSGGLPEPNVCPWRDFIVLQLGPVTERNRFKYFRLTRSATAQIGQTQRFVDERKNARPSEFAVDTQSSRHHFYMSLLKDMC